MTFEPVDFIAKLAALVPKPVFNIDVEKCRICGGTAKVIACIEGPVVIKKILRHLAAAGKISG